MYAGSYQFLLFLEHFLAILMDETQRQLRVCHFRIRMAWFTASIQLLGIIEMSSIALQEALELRKEVLLSFQFLDMRNQELPCLKRLLIQTKINDLLQ